MSSRWRSTDPHFPGLIMEPLREIRRLRQRPAHAVAPDEFDRKFHEDQDAFIKKAYFAVRHIRLLLANHPKARSVEVPEWLQKGKVKTF